MDIQQFKQISNSKIKAGQLTNQVKDTIKEYRNEKQDMQLGLTETFQPIIKAQQEVKETIDDKQDKLIEQLQKNQQALTSGLEDIAMMTYLPDKQPKESAKMPIGYKPAMLKSNFDKGFSIDEIEKVTKYNLYITSDIFKASMEKNLDLDDYDSGVGKLLKTLGQQKGTLSKGKSKAQNKNQIDRLDQDIKLIQKYRKRIKIIDEGSETISQGLKYTQPKRNAYKIKSNGQYGGLMIDIPKLLR